MRKSRSSSSTPWSQLLSLEPGSGIQTTGVLRWFAAGMLSAVLIFASACSSGTATQATKAGLRYEVSTRLADSSVLGRAPTIIATLVVTNVADTTQRLDWIDCPTGGPVWVRAYRMPGDRKLVWDANLAYPGIQCLLVGRYRDLLPGAQWQYNLPVRVSEVLGDSLPAGTYSFTVSASSLSPAYREELPAGQLTLVR